MAKMTGAQFDRRLRRRHRRRFGSPGAVLIDEAARRQQRRVAIAQLAEAVADEHCPQGSVEPRVIARRKGITISFGTYGDTFDGMLEHDGGRFHIYCNLDRVGARDAPRARFTLAHELGHYYIDDHRRALAAGQAPAHRSRCDHESTHLVEQEADHFAANLLAPEARFGAEAAGVIDGLDGLRALAGRFGTSLTATAIRYAACDIRPCAVVKWNWSGQAWQHVSPAVRRIGLGSTVAAPRDLVPGSPTARALNREQPGPTGFFEAGSTAADWFPGIEAADHRDVVVVEQAVPLGRFGVLTLLRVHLTSR